MVLFIHLATVKLQRLNDIILSFPGKLRHNIQLIYCLTNPKKFHKINYQTVFHKPIFFIPNNSLSEEILSKELQKSNVLIHQKYTSVHIINMIKELKDYEIFLETDDKNDTKFIDDKNLYLEIVSKLSEISNFKSKSLSNKKSDKKRKYVPISNYYTRGELKQAILSIRKRSIIQFDSLFREAIPKREIVKNVSHRFLRKYENKFQEIFIVSGNKTIKILKGVEYLSEVRQKELIDLIEKNASDKLNYRIIINGKIPDFLLNRNYHVKRFAPQLNKDIDIDDSPNKSALFIRILRDVCKQKGVKIHWVYSINDYINNDLFKELLNPFDGPNDLEESINRAINCKGESITTIKMTDEIFWYDLIHNRIKPKRKVQKLEKQRKVISIKKIKKPKKRNKILAEHSRAIREKILELNQKISAKKVNITEERKKEVTIPQPRIDPNKKNLEFRNLGTVWDIILDGDHIVYTEYSSKGIHLIKELVQNHRGPSKSIDGDTLDAVLLSKLPSVKHFRNTKAETEKRNQKKLKTKSKKAKSQKAPFEVTLNALRENVKTVAKIKQGKLKFLWGKDSNLFIFSINGCYYNPHKDIKIKFTE